MKQSDFAVEYLSSNKIYNHLERVKELLDTGDTLPIMMEIDPTNDCIRHCPNCRFSGNRFSKTSLSLDFMKKAIDQTSSFLKSVVFTGGENQSVTRKLLRQLNTLILKNYPLL